MDLFGRQYKIQIGELVVEELRCAFDIDTNLTRAPNKARFKVYNLNEEHRDLVESLARGGGVRFDAGYKTTGIGTLFQGDIKSAVSKYAGSDWVTEIEAGDGRDAIRSSRANSSTAPGANMGDLLRQAGRALGVGEGNMDRIASAITQSTSSTVTFSGRASDSLDRIVAATGLEWSVQRGNLQFLQRGQALAGELIVLDPGSGLIGSPSRDKDGTVQAECYIIPDLFPGRGVRLSSKKISGDFRVKRAQYTGDSHAGDWKIKSVLEAI